MKLLKKITINLIGFACLASVASLTHAAPTDDLLAKLKRTYPNIPFTQVNETPAPGIYEAMFGKDILYVESTGTYFFPTMVNMITKVNLGEARRDELNKVEFADLPLNDAIKTVQGSGQRKIAVFADPNCGYCKKLEANLTSLKDVTIYTFPVGILGPDSTAKTNALACATGDKSKLWHAMLIEGARPVDKTCSDASPARNLELFKRLGFQGTPSVVFQNGATLKGYAENARFEELMAAKK
jgi:thiol:disulfide interchange protein DsbC